MDHDALFVCRMMMRLYTVAPTLSGEQPCPELWRDYNRLEEGLFAAFLKEGIRPRAVQVLSDFNGVVKTVPELVFCLAEPSISVPDELYRLFGEYGVKDFSAPATPPVIRLAYGGRYYDREADVRLVTDGLQVGALGKIALDMFALAPMTKAGVSCRLTHELLHVFGVGEEEMAYYKPRAYLGLLEHVDRLSAVVLAAAKEARPRFESAAATVAAAHPQWVEALYGLGKRLCDAGYPDPPERAATAALSLPASVAADDSVAYQRADVLFM